MTHKYLMYPGCSVQRSAAAYLESTIAIQDKLAMEFEELKDWNCCGATEYHSVTRLPAHALVGRNLAIAQSQANSSDTLVAPCSACYLNLTKTDDVMMKDVAFGKKVNESLAAGGLHYDPGKIKVRHLLDVIFNDIGVDRIKELVTYPLKGLRVAAYYGCMVVRPDYVNRFDNPEYPTELEELISALGAEVVDFPLKTHCCSGHMTQISADTAYELIRRLVDGATVYEADLMVTLCPMCQLNLDAFQPNMNAHFGTKYEMPILYFTQLMGLAFGLKAKELGIGSEFISPKAALEKIGVEYPVEEDAVRKKKKEEGLPMPQMDNKFGGGC